MKAMKLALLPLLLAAAAQADTIPELVPVQPERVFVPRSFDDNDNSQITVTGNFPSTCFRMAPPIVEVNHALHQVRVQNRAFYYATGWCQRMLVPYVQMIDLGVLNAASYRIAFLKDDGGWQPSSQISIAHSKNPGPDDYLYALVSDAWIDTADGTKTLVLTGSLLNGCMNPPEVKVFYRPSDVIEVLPIVTMNSTGPCTQMLIPFSTRTELSPGWRGPTLVHVRSLNGQSVNKIVEF